MERKELARSSTNSERWWANKENIVTENVAAGHDHMLSTAF
jgi:hypothetical protein